MPKVSVLYVEDSVVGPHLQLLRHVCEPLSKSRPHVTVRFFDKLAVPPEHLSSLVGSIDLVEPGSFGLDVEGNANYPVFIGCESDDLLQLEHKPKFPTSEFHITVYDGPSQDFARELLRRLTRYRWGIRLHMPAGTSLHAIEIKKKRRSSDRAGAPPLYSPEIRRLFNEISGEELQFDRLRTYTDGERLALVDKICSHLEGLVDETLRFDRVREPRHEVALDEEALDVHLTPPELALAITRCALVYLDDKSQIDFGDPAVGTGAFYAALLKERGTIDLNSAIGIDISPNQVEAARWRWESKGMQVMLGDYLHMDQLPQRNLILANPPYRRHQQIPQSYKLELRQRASTKLGLRISGLSGQYIYFMLLAHEWMKAGAVAAWLIPSEFMQSAYGEALRWYLTHKVRVLRIHQFAHGDPQFETAKVLPCVVFLKNTAPELTDDVELSCGGTLEKPAHHESVPISKLPFHQRWGIPLRVVEEEGGIRVADLFKVRRGIATGANNFFIVDRHLAHTLKFPEEVLRPVLPKVKNLDSDVIERCKDGFPDVHPQLCLIDCSLPLDDIKRMFPSLYKYLRSGMESGLLDRNLVRSRTPWYRQEWREPAPFLCTYMGRGSQSRSPIRLLRNKSDAVATNTYLMLYPTPPLARALESDPRLWEILFSALKNMAQSLGETARTHAGGLRKVEPGELLGARLIDLPPALVNVAQKGLV